MSFKSAETALFDWMTPRKLLISIIQFSQGKADQVSGTSLISSSVMDFVQILPFNFTHFEISFADFY